MFFLFTDPVKSPMHFTYVTREGHKCKKEQALIGSGGFSRTYRMRHRMDRSIRAVKQLKTGSLDEVRTLARVPPHVGLVAYFGCFRNRRRHTWIVTGLVGQGETVADRLKQATARDVFRDIAPAVAHLHRHAILHRDIKAANIFASTRGDDGDPMYVLGDLGHARSIDGRGCCYVPPVGVVGRGHCVYRAPEVIAGSPYGPPSDIWQLGVVLFELDVGLVADDIVGNSATTGWHRDFGAWLHHTESGREAAQDLADDTCLAMLDATPHKRTTCTTRNTAAAARNTATNTKRLPTIGGDHYYTATIKKEHKYNKNSSTNG